MRKLGAFKLIALGRKMKQKQEVLSFVDVDRYSLTKT